VTINTKAVGFIGLGRMGRGMALNLIKSVDGLHVFDAQPDAMAVLTKAGAVPCNTPAEVAKSCDHFFLCLPSAPEVRTVIFGAEGIAFAGCNGLTIVDTTTLDRSEAIAFVEDAFLSSRGNPSTATLGTCCRSLGAWRRSGHSRIADAGA
jgi:3-hydroxyisobutyrate dehydrogenase-like beta-hydroxyacid dehydrogenase